MPKLGPDSKEYSFSLNCISRIKTSSQVGMKLLLKILTNLARISCGLLRNSGQLVRNFCAGPKWNVSQLGTHSHRKSLAKLARLSHIWLPLTSCQLGRKSDAMKKQFSLTWFPCRSSIIKDKLSFIFACGNNTYQLGRNYQLRINLIRSYRCE